MMKDFAFVLTRLTKSMIWPCHESSLKKQVIPRKYNVKKKILLGGRSRVEKSEFTTAERRNDKPGANWEGPY